MPLQQSANTATRTHTLRARSVLPRC